MIESKTSTYIKVPMDRVGALIGPDGSIKNIIEKKSTSRLDIDSQTGSIEIISPEDPLMAMRAAEVIKAIGRGFSPEKALHLFDDDMLILEIIDLGYIANTPRELKRLKGRIIGKNGRTREIFENLTGSKISVMGKTVSMMGYPDQVLVVRTGIEMLLKGSPHGPVYAFLERKRKELKESRW